MRDIDGIREKKSFLSSSNGLVDLDLFYVYVLSRGKTDF